MKVSCLVREAKRAEGRRDDALDIGLPRVNHRVGSANAAEARRFRVARDGGAPRRPAAGILVKPPVAKVLPQQPEFPEVIGNVLSDVGDCAVRAHKDLRLFALFIRAVSGRHPCLRRQTCLGGQYPAALVLARFLEPNGVFIFH